MGLIICSSKKATQPQNKKSMNQYNMMNGEQQHHQEKNKNYIPKSINGLILKSPLQIINEGLTINELMIKATIFYKQMGMNDKNLRQNTIKDFESGDLIQKHFISGLRHKNEENKNISSIYFCISEEDPDFMIIKRKIYNTINELNSNLYYSFFISLLLVKNQNEPMYNAKRFLPFIYPHFDGNTVDVDKNCFYMLSHVTLLMEESLQDRAAKDNFFFNFNEAKELFKFLIQQLNVLNSNFGMDKSSLRISHQNIKLGNIIYKDDGHTIDAQNAFLDFGRVNRGWFQQNQELTHGSRFNIDKLNDIQASVIVFLQLFGKSYKERQISKLLVNVKNELKNIPEQFTFLKFLLDLLEYTNFIIFSPSDVLKILNQINYLKQVVDISQIQKKIDNLIKYYSYAENNENNTEKMAYKYVEFQHSLQQQESLEGSRVVERQEKMQENFNQDLMFNFNSTTSICIIGTLNQALCTLHCSENEEEGLTLVTSTLDGQYLALQYNNQKYQISSLVINTKNFQLASLDKSITQPFELEGTPQLFFALSSENFLIFTSINNDIIVYNYNNQQLISEKCKLNKPFTRVVGLTYIDREQMSVQVIFEKKENSYIYQVKLQNNLIHIERVEKLKLAVKQGLYINDIQHGFGLYFENDSLNCLYITQSSYRVLKLTFENYTFEENFQVLELLSQIGYQQIKPQYLNNIYVQFIVQSDLSVYLCVIDFQAEKIIIGSSLEKNQLNDKIFYNLCLKQIDNDNKYVSHLDQYFKCDGESDSICYKTIKKKKEISAEVFNFERVSNGQKQFTKVGLLAGKLPDFTKYYDLILNWHRGFRKLKSVLNIYDLFISFDLYDDGDTSYYLNIIVQEYVQFNLFNEQNQNTLKLFEDDDEESKSDQEENNDNKKLKQIDKSVIYDFVIAMVEDMIQIHQENTYFYSITPDNIYYTLNPDTKKYEIKYFFPFLYKFKENQIYRDRFMNENASYVERTLKLTNENDQDSEKQPNDLKMADRIFLAQMIYYLTGEKDISFQLENQYINLNTIAQYVKNKITT